MILLGCLLAFGIAVAPRVMLVIAWIFSDRWPIVWGGDWIAPLLGSSSCPSPPSCTCSPGSRRASTGGTGSGILLGFILDVTNWAQGAANRRNIPGYPGGTPASSGSTT